MALARLNPALPAEALGDAFRQLTWPEGADLLQGKRTLQRAMADGATVECCDADQMSRGAQADAIDFDAVDRNDWRAVNEFTVAEGHHTRRPDVVLDESRTLAAVRDALLPGLVSGELRVKDAERVAARAR